MTELLLVLSVVVGSGLMGWWDRIDTSATYVTGDDRLGVALDL